MLLNYVVNTFMFDYGIMMLRYFEIWDALKQYDNKSIHVYTSIRRKNLHYLMFNFHNFFYMRALFNVFCFYDRKISNNLGNNAYVIEFLTSRIFIRRLCFKDFSHIFAVSN